MFEIGVIFDISKDLYYVKTKTGRYMSKARGIFRKQKFSPMVGDNVKIEIFEDNTACIVEVFDRKGNKKVYSNEDMNFSYRHSVIQETGEIISKVYFKMTDGNKEEIIARVNELNKMREEKQPLEYPSCGSVFKRPVGYFAGKLIQDAGLQGLTVGGAQVSTKHAGFMVNINNATCEDYKNLIKKVQEEVFKHSGVKLECEVKVLGE